MDGQPNFCPSMINATAMEWTENCTDLLSPGYDVRFKTLDVLDWIKTGILNSLTANNEAELDAKMTKDSPCLQLMYSLAIDVKRLAQNKECYGAYQGKMRLQSGGKTEMMLRISGRDSWKRKNFKDGLLLGRLKSGNEGKSAAGGWESQTW